VSLENDYLKVNVIEKGAELKSVVSKATNLEYMWSGDPAFWGKTSPVLFPIVGTLKNNTYLYQGKSYSLARHGFARDATFAIIEQKKDVVVFFLSSTPASREKYPFDFEFRISYRLTEDILEVTYDIRSTGNVLYFSLGAHPAFKVPLVNGSAYEDHYLEFNVRENSPRWPINGDGLIKDKPLPLLQNASTLHLTRTLFAEDALVFKDLRSNKISIKSETHQHGLEFYFEGFPYMGIWAAKNADFVCIEPWCGIADAETHDQQLISKEGVVRIGRGEIWKRSWKIRPY
jgi:galactose mutarotase-like enzyme